MRFTPVGPENKLVENKQRIQEAILYLMNRKKNLSQYEIVKSLFLADRSHLNKFGRPITFDNYVAMEHGPVPSLAYNALKPSYNYKSSFGVERPWTSIPDRADSGKNQFTALRQANVECLSISDKRSLDAALEVVLSLTFSQLRKLTHEDKAYIEAWDRRGRYNSADMRLSYLIEENGDELEAELVYLSGN